MKVEIKFIEEGLDHCIGDLLINKDDDHLVMVTEASVCGELFNAVYIGPNTILTGSLHEDLKLSEFKKFTGKVTLEQ